MNRLRETPEFWLVVWGFPTHGAWEFLHSPLYADHLQGFIYVLWTRLHCTAGDLLILLGAFWGISLLFRTRFWIREKRFGPVLAFLVAGLAYTGWSEWYNTQIKGAWAYTLAMPVIWKIGISPLLQWVVIPLILVFMVRRRLPGGPKRLTPVV